MIREATPDDCSGIAKICEYDLGYKCDEALVRKQLSSLDKNRECVFAAICDNNVVGFIHVEKYEVLYFQPMANILGLAVSSEYRRRGIGRALLNKAEEWAKSRSISLMRLNSGSSRKEAHNFYRNAGYNEEKEQIRFLKQI